MRCASSRQETRNGRSMEKEEFGSRLRAMRIQIDYTLQSQAQKVGCRAVYPRETEWGISMISVNSCNKIAEALNISVDYLL
jgi:transcriptional regulator with XRE-family HTH domain